MKKTANETKYERLVGAIEWDNWTKTEPDKTGEVQHWAISEVLYCRLDWLKEQIQSGTLEQDEALDTINMLQILISGITDNQLKRSK